MWFAVLSLAFVIERCLACNRVDRQPATGNRKPLTLLTVHHSMRVLIVGGTRFIGRCLAERLLDAGIEVGVFNRGETARDLPSELHLIRGDRRNLRSFRKAFVEYSPDVVVDTICFNAQEAEATVTTFSGIVDRLVILSSPDVYQAHSQREELAKENEAAERVNSDANA
jgi:hypothetical protein